jgi:TrmH family RNA methyltransferase
MIKSSQNPKIKLARALAGRPKERREAGAFLAEGVRLVEEALAANWPFRFALYSDELSERGNELVKKLEDKKIEIEKVESGLLQALGETETSQGILAVLNDSRLSISDSLNFVLIPDSIRDPGNLGTLLRSADAAGVQAVLIPPETTDAFAPKVVRAGMGAHFRLPIHSMDWDQIREFLMDRGRQTMDGLSSVVNGPQEHPRMQVYLAAMDGQSCWEMDLRQPLALIVGGEAEGASEDARKIAHQHISIPMAGKTESLNAAVAGSVLMFEVMRQRR